VNTDARTVLITGATSGLGRELALRLAAQGWSVLAHGRDQGRLPSLMPTAMVREARTAPISNLDEGVTATLRLITDPGLAGVTGEYFNGSRPDRALPEAYDPGFRAKLRATTAELLADYL
jgi:NAD(P)-dependent dehydrogenase (short-subunit alcohol dehydrogenase family)